MTELMKTLEEIVRAAGDMMRTAFTAPDKPTYSLKGRQDYLTAHDGAVEQYVREQIALRFPGDAVLGEEGGGAADGPRLWIVDPIDGTANFARALPHWCVAIALVVEARTELGVIYEAGADLLYTATRGEGAWRNGEPLRVSATTDPARSMVDVGYSSRGSVEAFGDLVTGLLRRGVNVTQCGSAALGLARVADGRLEGFAERHLYAWDALAGLLLVAEAGGTVNPFLVGDALSRGNQTIAATPALYPLLAEVLALA